MRALFQDPKGEQNQLACLLSDFKLWPYRARIEANHTVISVRVHHHFLPLVLVIFTRRLVRGFPTYQTLPEIM